MSQPRLPRLRPWVGWSLTSISALIIAAVAIQLRFHHLGSQPLWYDESWSAELVSMPMGQMLATIPHIESTPPLFYWLDWHWIRWFGDNRRELRELPAIFGCLTVLIIPWIAIMLARLHESVTRGWALVCGLTLMAVVATSPILVWYSQEARAYSMMVTCCALMLVAMVAFLGRHQKRWLVVWSLAASVGLASHYFSGYMILATFVTMMLVSHRRLMVLVAAIIPSLVGVALLPLLLTQLHSGRSSWIAHLNRAARLQSIMPNFLLGWTGSFWLAVSIAVLLLALSLFGLWQARSLRLAVTVLVPVSLGLGLPILLMFFGSDQVLVRNLLAMYPAVLLALVGGIIYAPKPVRLLGISLVLALAVMGLVVHAHENSPLWKKPNWPAVEQAIGKTAYPRLILNYYGQQNPIAYERPDLIPTKQKVVVQEIDVITYPGWKVAYPKTSGLCTWGAYCSIARTYPIQTLALAGWHQVSLVTHGWFDIERFVASRPVAVDQADFRAIASPHVHMTVYYAIPQQGSARS